MAITGPLSPNQVLALGQPGTCAAGETGCVPCNPNNMGPPCRNAGAGQTQCSGPGSFALDCTGTLIIQGQLFSCSAEEIRNGRPDRVSCRLGT